MTDRPTRRTFLVSVAVAAMAGCQGDDPAAGDGEATATSGGNPATGDAEQLGDLRLTSPAFADGEAIPVPYGANAENVNPPLSIANVPSGAESLVLVVDDPDAVEPAGKVWLHWLVWNIPASRTEIPEDWFPESALEGTNDSGSRGYSGPAPPEGTHTYRFKLYALDTTLDLAESASKPEVCEAMQGHVLGQTQLTGIYSPQ